MTTKEFKHFCECLVNLEDGGWTNSQESRDIGLTFDADCKDAPDGWLIKEKQKWTPCGQPAHHRVPVSFMGYERMIWACDDCYMKGWFGEP